ncbi:hypothetical protein McanMca71_007819 [Microsporum canis]
MASDEVNTVELSLQGTPTKTVTLAPERATVIRELADVPIKAGPNEITICGFDPRIDFDSLRVTGHGPATITDIQTLVVYRDEEFNDLYPSEEESEDDDTDSEDPDDDFGVDRSELDKVIEEIKRINTRLAFLENDKTSSTQSLSFLDTYGKSMLAKDVEVDKVSEYIGVYQKQRASLRELYEKSETETVELNEKKEKLERKKQRLEDNFHRERARAAKPSRKEREAKRKERDLRRKKEREVLGEIRMFWSPRIGRVVLHVEGHGDGTTPTSRRGSVVSAKKPDFDDTITLSLTYVTSFARWTPRYDLMLNTPTSSGKLVYRAEYYNRSFETWKDTTIILSTSQTSFSGVDEHIPSLLPWNVGLRKHDVMELEVATDTLAPKRMSHWSGALTASAETQKKSSRHTRHNLEGPANEPTVRYMKASRDTTSQPFPPPPPPPRMPAGGLFGSAPVAPASSSYQNEYQRPMAQQMLNQTVLFGGSAGGRDQPDDMAQCAAMAPYLDESDDEDNDDDQLDDDASTIHGSSNVLAFRQSSRQDYGLTTTYNVPGSRTLQPSSYVRRHIIAEIELSSVTFSHVIIPKLKQAAFLKGRVTNTSTTPLLRGKAGLTVDDAFLGKATIPNCNPGVPFNLNLGVDPAIQVTYSKPKVRRATTGYFNKEDCAIFTRVCRINNTKSSPVSLVVLDQVPVSEDERIRVRLIEPKGLDRGDSAKIGAEVCIDRKRAKDWGKGSVSINKDGEVKWAISLEKAVDIKLVLEYEAKIPSGLEVVGL